MIYNRKHIRTNVCAYYYAPLLLCTCVIYKISYTCNRALFKHLRPFTRVFRSPCTRRFIMEKNKHSTRYIEHPTRSGFLTFSLSRRARAHTHTYAHTFTTRVRQSCVLCESCPRYSVHRHSTHSTFHFIFLFSDYPKDLRRSKHVMVCVCVCVVRTRVCTIWSCKIFN